MPSHIAFLEENRELLVGPVLIIGSKRYDYDMADPRDLLDRLGVGPVIGIDLEDGPSVDVVADLCALPPDFVEANRGRFRTVLCMEILTHCDCLFGVEAAIDPLLTPGGALFLSECIVRKVSRMPADHWRFTYTGLQRVFPSYEFHDDRARMSLVRMHKANLVPYSTDLPQILHERHPDETRFGHLLRRVHRKWFASGVFSVSRLLPETSIAAVATKPGTPTDTA